MNPNNLPIYNQNSNNNPQQLQNPYYPYNMRNVSYYNPLIVQNYYQMRNNQMQQTQMNPGNMLQAIHNYFASPYTLNNTNNYPHANTSNSTINKPYSYPPYKSNSNNINSTNSFNKPVNKISKEEEDDISKWILSRKRNFPTKEKIQEKETIGKIKKNAGMISKLELKLREKIKIMTPSNGFRKKQTKRFRRSKKRSRKQKNSNNFHNNEHNNIEEDGEIIETKEFLDSNRNNEKNIKHENISINKDDSINNNNRRIAGFKYRSNKLYEELIKPDKYKEMNVILQCFRYFVNEKLV